eukprot:TRINITY_DN10827_c0_g1_i4.p1 TRINITY_DN10827_c0_g1~~TRINITY_DN10827_c0_g1_i4.p1  ORF type:complete len:215 (-),score=29.38 TRINITY_DN10827_c0_g1_i4:1517-2161(-)
MEQKPSKTVKQANMDDQKHSLFQNILNFLSQQLLGLSIFASMADQTFSKFDYNGDGKISEIELHFAIILFYDQLNLRLPCHIHPPGREDIKDLIVQFDTNKSGYIEKEEFGKLLTALVGTKSVWYDSLVVRVLASILVRMILIPSIAVFMYTVLASVGLSVFGMDAAILTAALLIVFNGLGGENRSIVKIREAFDMYAVKYMQALPAQDEKKTS